MQHIVRHLTRFSYNAPVRESVMELRMQPLADARQKCLRFTVSTTPKARVFAYRDHLGNAVHYFNLPGRHARLDITAESAVDIAPGDEIPEHLDAAAWGEFDSLADRGDWVYWLHPSHFAADTPALRALARELEVTRRADPLSLLRDLNHRLFTTLKYEPRTTKVDSPIDEALVARAGVCQDFAHIMTSLVRGVGIPCRYVSGYLIPGENSTARRSENSTHAWVEAWMPGLGWVGFDPTNDTLARERHITIAVGRDYADVPPARGVFKGDAGSELGVAVSITRPNTPITGQELVPTITWIAPAKSTEARLLDEFHQQQQQQQ